jgi:hypothetical protein
LHVDLTHGQVVKVLLDEAFAKRREMRSEIARLREVVVKVIHLSLSACSQPIPQAQGAMLQRLSPQSAGAI